MSTTNQVRPAIESSSFAGRYPGIRDALSVNKIPGEADTVNYEIEDDISGEQEALPNHFELPAPSFIDRGIYGSDNGESKQDEGDNMNIRDRDVGSMDVDGEEEGEGHLEDSEAKADKEVLDEMLETLGQKKHAQGINSDLRNILKEVSKGISEPTLKSYTG
ncbi:hypothetical protein V5O48_011721, partial [Marasmius crinis-equi]